MSARTHDGRSARILNLIDESTRKCLLIRAERRWSSAKVIEALADVMVMRGIPEHLRSDSGLSSSRRTCASGWPPYNASFALDLRIRCKYRHIPANLLIALSQFSKYG
jgi:hypothetical protein